MVLDEEAEPPPTCPGEFREIFDESQTLRTAGDNQQIVVALESQMPVQELVESRLETMIAAMHNEGAGRLALEFGIDLVGHIQPRALKG
jgi:hypothetical protein